MDCSSLIVKCLRDNYRCNSSDKSRSWKSGTLKVQSSVLTGIPKETFLAADGKSFSGEEAKPKESKKETAKPQTLFQPALAFRRHKNRLNKRPQKNRTA